MAQRKAVRRARNRRAWVLRCLLIAFAAFLVLKAIQFGGQIDEKVQAVAEVEEQKRLQKIRNEESLDLLESVEANLENEANEDGYYYPNQQIYQSAAG